MPPKIDLNMALTASRLRNIGSSIDFPKILFFVLNLGFLWCISENTTFACQDGYEVIGVSGTDGLHGTTGDPGTTGGSGTNGSAAIAVADQSHPQTVFDPITGRRGLRVVARAGWGGIGGNGGDGWDLGGSTNGGDGGQGGNGAIAIAIVNGLEANPLDALKNALDFGYSLAVGGNGGRGGQGGGGYNNGSAGIGGQGGLGGQAFASTTSISTAIAEAWGGNAGASSSPGTTALNGSIAHGIASVYAPLDNQDHFALARLFLQGGNGGTVDTADSTAGDGANVFVGNEFSRVKISSSGRQEFQIHAVGGRGGEAVSRGIAGQGGNATVDLAALINQGDIVSTQNTQIFDIKLSGGDGGDALHHSASRVGNGGSASLLSQATVISRGSFQVDISLVGGNAGNVNQSTIYQGSTEEPLPSAFGGDAYLDKTYFSNQVGLEPSPSIFNEFNIHLKGGDGVVGDAFSAGQTGATASYVDSIVLNTGGNTKLNIRATGGNGGGNAYVISDFAITGGSKGAVGSIDIQGTAFAGDNHSAAGGNAHVVLHQRSEKGPIVLNANAGGGYSAAGPSGWLNARANGISFSDSAVVNSTARAASFDPQLHQQLTRVGSDAQSFARAFAAYGDAVATSEAAGGLGSERSGFAKAVSVAGNFRSGNATSLARSVARADRDHRSPNNASSHAVASASAGVSQSHAIATAYGHFNSANSIAAFRSLQGSAIAEAYSSSTNWFHDARVRTSISANHKFLQDYSHAIAMTSFRNSKFSRSHESGFTQILVNPVRTGIDTFLSNQQVLRDIFKFGDHPFVGNVFAIGQMGSRPDDYVTELLTVEHSIRLELDLWNGIQDTGNLTLGFLNAGSRGAGFQDLHFRFGYQDETVLDVHFTEPQSALSFFRQTAIDLGPLFSDANNRRVFEIMLSATYASQFAGFQFDFIFGNVPAAQVFPPSTIQRNVSSVPEPNGVFLLAAGIIAHVILKRKGRRPILSLN